MYAYVGPAELLGQVRPGMEGKPIWSPADVRPLPQDEPFTYVVGLDGTLRIAPRRSEHVACAGGQNVLAAGEITFDGTAVTEVSNQSTGYCPGAESWPAVADALDRAGLERPDCFTATFVFRHCPECGELNVVKDEHYVCVFCDAELASP
ncbi:hypothetical protein E1287_20285 [Actinomadura sp. KC06]|uniref:hypothetical protein n=1 Tax=Actinomadura sp. KC06 TaxID=2530369 RepID=UPI001048E64F|nr:hypothetical protein [Actinomadura sp. KC06]TDD33163.1 hypothetical protein E1287_20285 [Actinomadura sp. KC06]